MKIPLLLSSLYLSNDGERRHLPIYLFKEKSFFISDEKAGCIAGSHTCLWNSEKGVTIVNAKQNHLTGFVV